MFSNVPRRSRTTAYKSKPSVGRGVLQTSVKRKSRYVRKQLPARLRGSRSSYNTAKIVSKVLAATAEQKLLKINPQNEIAPTQVNAGVGLNAYYTGFVLNSVPTGWEASVKNLGGVTITPGDKADERIGDYVYLKKTHLTFEIDAQPVSSDAHPVPMEYRMIVFKQRRSAMPTGRTVYPQDSLFIDEVGEVFGHADIAKDGSDIMLQPLNKRDWVIFADKRFKLTNPTIYNPNGVANSWNWFNPKYESTKRISVSLPHFGKAHYDPVTHKPNNIDTFYGVFIYARPMGKDYAANDWEVNCRGTTSYTDN